MDCPFRFARLIPMSIAERFPFRVKSTCSWASPRPHACANGTLSRDGVSYTRRRERSYRDLFIIMIIIIIIITVRALCIIIPHSCGARFSGDRPQPPRPANRPLRPSPGLGGVRESLPQGDVDPRQSPKEESPDDDLLTLHALIA
ncbi:uncharacterized protein K489DRAFT_249228 [Dissoconium aciculare CBS 342.82]|uniref:Uncharacterized protein n=1 Tax=Dissoconium aciculare CBS 342.82 TaxID=1314786 RepID=A0A6J3M0T9_9PEZI|nr:uncharacterized protein K489DRAFT_249228 [Dissoconium aciculare CBS 342.82]KAF1821503.1 hypothetical protein K489DRAFT_249228 [Dissoconium aciculare CBS 342.82]